LKTIAAVANLPTKTRRRKVGKKGVGTRPPPKGFWGEGEGVNV